MLRQLDVFLGACVSGGYYFDFVCALVFSGFLYHLCVCESVRVHCEGYELQLLLYALISEVHMFISYGNVEFNIVVV